MPGREFELTAHRESAGNVVFELHGDITAAAQPKLESAIGSVEDATTLVLDFGDVDYINSTGIAVIVGLLARARAAGLTVMAYSLSDHYSQIFRITRLSDFMEIYPDRGSALQAAGTV